MIHQLKYLSICIVIYLRLGNKISKGLFKLQFIQIIIIYKHNKALKQKLSRKFLIITRNFYNIVVTLMYIQIIYQIGKIKNRM